MRYPFECPKCGKKQYVNMPIKEYVATGHYCSACNTEMVREVKSLVCGMSVDSTNSFYRKCN